MFTSSLKRTLLPILTVAFIGLVQLAATASAMCVYNNTEIDIFVEFDCSWKGILCSNVWKTEPQNHYCRPGKGGELHIEDPALESRNIDNIDFVDVAEHGWVEMNKTGSEVEVCAYQPNEDPRGRVCIDFAAADTASLEASTEQRASLRFERTSWFPSQL